jgi:hypothetical protein
MTEEIEDDILAIKKDRGQLNKREKATIGCYGEPCEKEGKTGWRSHENAGQVDLGF